MTETKEVKAPKKEKVIKVSKEEIMEKHRQTVQFLQNMVSSIETDLKRIHVTLNQLAKFDLESPEKFVEIVSNSEIKKEIEKEENEENIEVME